MHSWCETKHTPAWVLSIVYEFMSVVNLEMNAISFNKPSLHCSLSICVKTMKAFCCIGMNYIFNKVSLVHTNWSYRFKSQGLFLAQGIFDQEFITNRANRYEMKMISMRHQTLNNCTLIYQLWFITT